MADEYKSWWIYRGAEPERWSEGQNKGLSLELDRLPRPPPWRDFTGGQASDRRGTSFIAEEVEIDRVNAALMLRRPLLVTGHPGTGKTSLAYAIADELGLGPVLRWSITSRTTLHDGLYRYDPIGRLQDTRTEGDAREVPGIDKYLTLGPLGTAFFARPGVSDDPARAWWPRIVLIDEIDKGDIDLPNDLLHLFEEGAFEIPELARVAAAPDGVETKGPGFRIRSSDFRDPESFLHGEPLLVPADGWVRCKAFPLVIMTSNGEREFPPAFMRRCLHLHMGRPDPDKLKDIVKRHFSGHKELAERWDAIETLVNLFWDRREGKAGKPQELAADQLLSAVHLVLEHADPARPLSLEALSDLLFVPLSQGDT